MPEVKKQISVLTASGSNVTGLVPYAAEDFLTEQISVTISGSGPAIKSLANDGACDVFPGDVPSNGDLRFSRDLYPGEVIVMSVASGSGFLVKVGSTYDNTSKKLDIRVHLEKGGKRVSPAPTSASVRVLKDNVLVKNLGTQTVPDSLGVFRFLDTTLTLVRNEIYDLDITVNVPEGPVPSTQQLVNL